MAGSVLKRWNTAPLSAPEAVTRFKLTRVEGNARTEDQF
jgi:hypothetical protein